MARDPPRWPRCVFSPQKASCRRGPQQMQPGIQLQTGTLTSSAFGNPVDAQEMQLDDPEAPLDEATETSIQEFLKELMQELREKS